MSKKTITSPRAGVIVVSALDGVMQATRMFAHELFDIKMAIITGKSPTADDMLRLISENEKLIAESMYFLKNSIKEGTDFIEPV